MHIFFFILVVTFLWDIPFDKSFVLAMLAVSIPLHLPKTFLQYVLQGTNRIKEYARLSILDRSIYVILVLCIVVLRIDDYKGIILADLAGKTGSLIYAVYQCRDIVFSKAEKLSGIWKEAWANISAGMNLMIANIAGMLIIGIVRLGIENQWDVVTFGKVSLTMSVSNLLMVFIRSIATIMFPLLRRINSEKFVEIYSLIRTSIMPLLLGLIVFYYPVKILLSAWLPQYAESLNYMALLFPMCVYESKMSMLIEIYMKSLRKERMLLLVNVLTVLMSVLLTTITVFGRECEIFSVNSDLL